MSKRIYIFLSSIIFYNYMFGQGNVDTFTVYKNHWECLDLKDGFYLFKKGETVIEKGLIKNNSPEGIWHYYHSNGNLSCVMEVKQIDNKVVIIGNTTWYHPNGNIDKSETYSLYKNDSIRCYGCYIFDTISDSRVPVLWVNYFGSIPIGTTKEYYENGNLKRETFYNDPIIYLDPYGFSSKDKKVNKKWVIDYPCNFMPSKINFYNEQGIFTHSW